MLGDSATAQALADEAMRIAEASGDVWNKCNALLSTGLVALKRGDLEQARATLEHGLGLVRQKWIPPPMLIYFLMVLGKVASHLWPSGRSVRTVRREFRVRA